MIRLLFDPICKVGDSGPFSRNFCRSKFDSSCTGPPPPVKAATPAACSCSSATSICLMDAFVRRTSPAMPLQESPAKVMCVVMAPSPMQLLPDEVFAMISKLLLGPLDQLYTPYGCARAIASLGQTNQHFRLAMQKLWPVRLVNLLVAFQQCVFRTATVQRCIVWAGPTTSPL